MTTPDVTTRAHEPFFLAPTSNGRYHRHRDKDAGVNWPRSIISVQRFTLSRLKTVASGWWSLEIPYQPTKPSSGENRASGQRKRRSKAFPICADESNRKGMPLSSTLSRESHSSGCSQQPYKRTQLQPTSAILIWRWSMVFSRSAFATRDSSGATSTTLLVIDVVRRRTELDLGQSAQACLHILKAC